MANYSKDLEERNFSRQAREARAERRALRQQLIYGRLHDAFDKEAQFNFNLDSGPKDSAPIPSGMHPGDAAISLVHEVIAEYRVPGDIKLRYAGMDRKAGRGGHHISEGTIFVEGTVKPVQGFANQITVPIVVHGSRMLAPSLLYMNGVPRVIAQSTFDDLVETGEVDHERYLSQYNREQHVLPTSRTKGAASVRQRDISWETVDPRKEHEQRKKEEKEREEKAKQRRRQQQQQQIRAALRGWFDPN